MFVHFFCLSDKIFVTDFSAPMRATVFKFCVHLHRFDLYCVEENHNAEIYFAFFFPFYLFFFISHSNVMHSDFFFKDFLGTIKPRILKVNTNIGLDVVLCKRESVSSCLSYPLLSIFLLSNKNVRHTFLSSNESMSLNLYCVRDNQHSHAYHVICLSIFLSLE